MKKLLIIVLGIGAAVGIAVGLNRQNPSAAQSGLPAGIPATKATDALAGQVAETEEMGSAVPAVHAEVAATAPELPAASTAPGPAAKSVNAIFAQAIEALISPQADHEQRKAAWKRLRKSGKLDDAIVELEQRTANDPRSAQNMSALGQAYYKKAGQIEDIREQAILAMKADQTLEAALNLDPSDWEARFTKTAGMSYWPTQLNKGPEVIAGFEQLIQQQEARFAEPGFAETYLLLGNYYQTLGQPEQAARIWQRGASQFPNDEELKAKLAK